MIPEHSSPHSTIIFGRLPPNRNVHPKSLWRNAVSLIGPPIGSFLFTVARAVPFLADALSYLASVGSLLWIWTELQGKRDKSGRNVLHDLAINLVTGFTWMYRQSGTLSDYSACHCTCDATTCS